MPSHSHKISLLSPFPFLIFPPHQPWGILILSCKHSNILYQKSYILFSTREISSQNFLCYSTHCLNQNISIEFHWFRNLHFPFKTRGQLWGQLQRQRQVFEHQCKIKYLYSASPYSNTLLFTLSRKFYFVWGEKGDCQIACHQISCSPLAIFSTFFLSCMDHGWVKANRTYDLLYSIVSIVNNTV